MVEVHLHFPRPVHHAEGQDDAGNGIPPLCKAAEDGHVPTIRAICETYASIMSETGEETLADDEYDRHGVEPSWCGRNGLYCVEELVNMRDPYCGFSPLMLSAREGHLDAVKVLVKEFNADLEVVSDDGKVLSSALMILLLARHQLIAFMQWTALLIAAWNRHHNVVEYLISVGADQHWTNSRGLNLSGVERELEMKAQQGTDPLDPPHLPSCWLRGA